MVTANVTKASGNIGRVDRNNVDSFSQSVTNFLLLLRAAGIVFLLCALFAASLILWVWIASFRSGWDFWVWAKKERKNEAISASLIYGFLILLISPFLVFFDWTQKKLPKWLQLPDTIPLRQFIKEQLDIDLGDDFPFSVLKFKTDQQQIQSGNQKP